MHLKICIKKKNVLLYYFIVIHVCNRYSITVETLLYCKNVNIVSLCEMIYFMFKHTLMLSFQQIYDDKVYLTSFWKKLSTISHNITFFYLFLLILNYVSQLTKLFADKSPTKKTIALKVDV